MIEHFKSFKKIIEYVNIFVMLISIVIICVYLKGKAIWILSMICGFSLIVYAFIHKNFLPIFLPLFVFIYINPLLIILPTFLITILLIILFFKEIEKETDSFLMRYL